ncbi:MAG TPA: bifunctional UDP-3-O-[3-hydroxymyristoyl] N-acetylglucosamine deacetylase/3-hydroxyacyl-ACP dehydratase [Candidatus Syntrophosphaera sp.]|jgi:UDP-3-O-[3-hydroxymyristoyl] N-acetylglucosamine deacetylase/3-hydroxyacyl-[acyl-carrier-protein] dehydratase|nr:bifunctional UDP-3-O-[3-hydroxymyristoyl] N-acetylglucosamine deacetylase/3-hydroxyacyl-ACP dehydratase [Candidatus Syntrophosphaera sp.]HOH47885.1 bifunctional UDP-3-O-[3-hydroxymyristoyl] N-acetylglucosamine deacetylase/3-hydroxyacyl-ACP dehydratase [Candidatus Syntrophosphaera sp.]HPW38222.1 bifunctional UDP-3-O-[3-hydroxymyristoyl] N-acetylglucosamine deacetylase/3-hydroxyacyl-ACP dehydratase [Candidatus Syntrophosphaera sp.]HPX67041.1 bifunctional UDP-3-O-[3-hydroxymyristoyl] N-acetylglu
MAEFKHTIKSEVSYTGVGLHSGEISTIRFKPAGKDEGIVFIRTDLPDKPEIPADIDHVVDISRGTTIGLKGVTVGTIEHVLAAVKGLMIDNIRIEIDGPEVPVGDGSPLDFVNLLKQAGYEEQDSERVYFEFDEAISYSCPEDNVDVVVVPSNELKVTFMIDYKHPHLGTQYTFLPNLRHFERDFAGARTFCFIKEILQLKEQGLIKGGSLDNALVIAEPDMSTAELEHLREVFNYHKPITVSPEGILESHPLRYSNEFVRHKVVDLIGDMALLGMPIRGHILAARSGHKTNVELVKKLRQIQLKHELKKKYQKDHNKDLVFDINAIMRIIPHRYPFLLVDKIIDLKPGESITGIKNVTINEPFFQGHFPGHPIMPGVLIVEGMAQTGGIILMRQMDDPAEWVAYFASIDNVKFRKPVLPGDTLRYELKVISLKRSLSKMHGEAYVGDEKVAEGDFLAMLQKRDS